MTTTGTVTAGAVDLGASDQTAKTGSRMESSSMHGKRDRVSTVATRNEREK